MKIKFLDFGFLVKISFCMIIMAMFYGCKGKNQKFKSVYLNNTPKYVINKSLDGLEEIEVYPVNENIYVRNDVFEKKWTSSLFLVSFSEILPVKIQSNYVYDVKVIKTNWLKGILLLIFDSTHRGNGDCLIYYLNLENNSLNLIYNVKKIKVNGFLFNNQPLNLQVIDNMVDSMELIFYGIKDDGEGATYDYKKKIQINSKFEIINEGEEFSEDYYVSALLHHICNAKQSNHLSVARNEILKYISCKYEFKNNIFSKFSGIKLDIIKTILNKFDSKIKISNPNAILNIIDQKKIEYYQFLFFLIEDKDVLVKFGEKEKLFIKNYDKYLRGIISDLDQI
jgi:hypothetical protein